MNWIKRKYYNWQEALVKRIAYAVRSEFYDNFISTIGIQDLEDIVKRAKENEKEFGFQIRINLAELYITILDDRIKNGYRREEKGGMAGFKKRITFID